MEISRRKILLGSVVVAAAAVIPVIPVLAETVKEPWFHGNPVNINRKRIVEQFKRFLILFEKDMADYWSNVVMSEFNDNFTRNNAFKFTTLYLDSFKENLVYDYNVICDERNNSPTVIDNNDFKLSVYLKPKYSVHLYEMHFDMDWYKYYTTFV